MDNEELPEYKRTFLREMDELRQQERLENQPQGPSILAPEITRVVPPVENNIINTAQYSSSNWKQQLNQTSYNKNHQSTNHQMSMMVNPQIARKNHNIQLTQISQYSNAMHNKTVFVNPKFTSC